MSVCPVMAWTLAARSLTVNPSGAGARARTAARAARVRVLLRSTPPTRVTPIREGAARLVEGVVGNEPDVDAVQRGGESFDHAGQAGDDGGELVQGPAAAELFGVVRDGLEAQHAFALPDTRPPGKGGS